MIDWNLDNLTKEEFDAMCAITEGQDHRPEPSYAEILAKVQEMREAKEESDYRRDREIESAEFRGNYGRAHELREQKKWTESFNKKQEDAYYAQREVNREKTRREKAFRERSQNSDIHNQSRINGLKPQQYPEPIAPNNEALELKESIRKKINDDTNLTDIVADIKKQDQETINYLAAHMARYPGDWYNKKMDSDHKTKFLGVGLTLYDKSTGRSKNMLKSELLKFRVGHYNDTDRKEMLNLFPKAKKMLNGEIVEDVAVKGLTRKSYTKGSYLHEALRESNLER